MRRLHFSSTAPRTLFSVMGGFLNFVTASLFEYETQKVVQITSKKVGLIYRAIQLAFCLYIILWVMWYEKGYQSFDSAVSGVTTKLKGVTFTNLTNYPAIGQRIWDVADYVVPPQQNSAFFVITNVVITPGQRQGHCEEDIGVWKITCKNDSDCRRGERVMIGSGIKTGKCVKSTRRNNTRVCEVYAWCPTEYDRLPIPHKSILRDAADYTVLLKNSIEFPRYKVKRRNILPWMKKKFLYTCRYDPNHPKNRFCPIIKIGDILRFAKANEENIFVYGGMVSIHISWDCNLDFDVEQCVPKYTFRRLDNPHDKVGKGWNFRFGYHYSENGTERRDLIKAYGIQFFITVTGKGGKFDFLSFTMNLGSGLALLGLASVLCDVIILNIMKNRKHYRSAKFDTVEQQEREFLRQNLKGRDTQGQTIVNSDVPSDVPSDETRSCIDGDVDKLPSDYYRMAVKKPLSCDRVPDITLISLQKSDV